MTRFSGIYFFDKTTKRNKKILVKHKETLLVKHKETNQSWNGTVFRLGCVSGRSAIVQTIYAIQVLLVVFVQARVFVEKISSERSNWIQQLGIAFFQDRYKREDTLQLSRFVYV